MATEEISPHRPLFKASILGLSVITQTVPLISVAIPELAKAFPTLNPTQLQLISVMPNLAAMIFTLLSSWFAKKLGIRNTILFGLILFVIGGAGPSLFNDYSIFLILRFIMGMGLGLFNPFSVSLMYDYYEKKELKSMLGYQTASQNLGSAIFALLLGFLVTLGWRQAYAGYLVAIIPLILFAIVVKHPGQDQSSNDNQIKKPELKNTANFAVVLLMLLTMFLFMSFSMITVILSSLVVSEHITTAAVASTIISGLSVASLVSAPFFGNLSQKLHNFIMPLSLLGIAIGYLLLIIGKSTLVITIGVLLAGIFFGWALPQIMLRVKIVAPKGGENFSTSLVLLGINIGVFLAPTVWNGIANMFKNDSPKMICIECMICLLIMTIITFIFAIINRKSISNN